MRFAIRNVSRILRSAVLLLALLLAACGMPGGLSAETAALAFLFDEQLSFSKDIDPFSIEFLQKQDFLGQVLLLGTFQVNDEADQHSDCIMLFSAYQTANKSWSDIGQGSCAPYSAKEPRPRNDQDGKVVYSQPGLPQP